MHITLLRSDLVKPLSHVAGVVERRQSLPILAYALIKSDGGTISMTGTDLEVEATVRVTGEVRVGGTALVPARKLLDICKALPADASLDIRVDGAKIAVKAGRSRFSLATLPVGDFPSVAGGAAELSLEVGQTDLRRLLEETHFCMAQQDVRYYLNGVLIEIGKRWLRAVATDGHRMAVSEMPLAGEISHPMQIILPRKAVQELVRILDGTEGNVRLEIGKSYLKATMGEIGFITKLIDGRYPDYSKVLPANQDKHLDLEKEQLRETLARVAILANEKYRGVRLGLEKNMLRISANNPEQEEAQEELPVSYGGPTLEIGFNVTYLLEALGAIRNGKVILGLSDANSSCLIRGNEKPSAQYVIMPMRL